MYSHCAACTKDDNDHAIDLVMQGKGDESFEFISEKLKECPNDIDLRQGRIAFFLARKMYRAALEDVEYLLKIDPLNQDYLMERCTLNESIDQENNKASHRACYKNVSELIKSKRKGEPLFDTMDWTYVLAVSMAEMPEAGEIRRQYLKLLDSSDAEPHFVKTMRDMFLHFDRKNFLVPR